MTLFLKETLSSKILEPFSCQFLPWSDRKHADWKHQKMAWNVHNRGQGGSEAVS